MGAKLDSEWIEPFKLKKLKVKQAGLLMKVNTFPPSILFAVTGQFLLVET